MWFRRALTDRARHHKNIERLDQLYSVLRDLKFMAPACQSCTFTALGNIVDIALVKGRPKIHAKLQDAYIGPMNQKIVLDAPLRFADLMSEAMDLVHAEIVEETERITEEAPGNDKRGLQEKSN